MRSVEAVDTRKQYRREKLLEIKALRNSFALAPYARTDRDLGFEHHSTRKSVDVRQFAWQVRLDWQFRRRATTWVVWANHCKVTVLISCSGMIAN
jgi:hypothetical protein